VEFHLRELLWFPTNLSEVYVDPSPSLYFFFQITWKWTNLKKLSPKGYHSFVGLAKGINTTCHWATLKTNTYESLRSPLMSKRLPCLICGNACPRHMQGHEIIEKVLSLWIIVSWFPNLDFIRSLGMKMASLIQHALV